MGGRGRCLEGRFQGWWDPGSKSMKPECQSLGLCCLTCKQDIPWYSAFAIPSVWSNLSHFFPWPEQSHVCSSSSPVPSLWQGPGFHVPLPQLHEAHASLLGPWFSQEFQHQLGAASRCAGCQGKQEVSSWPSHKQQARQALHWKCPGCGQLFPPTSPPGLPLLTHPQWLPIALRRQPEPCITSMASPEPQDLSNLRSVCLAGLFLPQGLCICCSSTWNTFPLSLCLVMSPHLPGPTSVPSPPLRSLTRLPTTLGWVKHLLGFPTAACVPLFSPELFG